MAISRILFPTSERASSFCCAWMWLFLTQTRNFPPHPNDFSFIPRIAAIAAWKIVLRNGKKKSSEIFVNCANTIWHISIEMHWKTGNEKEWIDEPPLFFACYIEFSKTIVSIKSQRKRKSKVTATSVTFRYHVIVLFNAFVCVYGCILFSFPLSLSQSLPTLIPQHFCSQIVRYR